MLGYSRPNISLVRGGCAGWDLDLGIGRSASNLQGHEDTDVNYP